MKKTIGLLILIPLLAAALPAAAQTPLQEAVDAVYYLLVGADNVTVDAHAVFSLEGERFKTADGHYVQDNDASLLRWHLLTPLRDRTKPDRKGGYTVIANGEDLYVLEDFEPDTVKTGGTFVSTGILRRSSELSVIVDLVRALAESPEMYLGAEAVTSERASDGTLTVRLRCGEDSMEPLAQHLVNLGAQFIARRYFFTDYDYIGPDWSAAMDFYGTVTDAILGCTRAYSLRDADITFLVDEPGHLLEASGSLALALHTSEDGVLTLDIPFRITTSSWDSSQVPRLTDPTPADIRKAAGF